MQLTISSAQFASGPLVPFIVADLGLTGTQVGVVGGAVPTGRFLSGFFTGWLTDRFGVRAAILSGPAMAGLVLATLALVPGYTWLVALLVLFGIFQSYSTPLSVRGIMEWFPRRERAFALSVKQAGVPAGSALAAAVMPPLALWLGWSRAMAVSGLLLSLAAVGCSLSYRSPRPGEGEALPRASGDASLLAGLYLLRDWRIAAAMPMAMAFNALQATFIAFLAFYLTGPLGLSRLAAGGFLAVSQASGALMRPVAGLASDRLGTRRLVLAACSAMACLGLVGLAFTHPGVSGALLWLIVIVLGMGVFAWAGVFLTMLGELCGANRAGVAAGLSSPATGLGGIIGPPLFGLMVDTWGWTAALLTFAAALGVFVVALAVLRMDPGEGAAGAARPAGIGHTGN